MPFEALAIRLAEMAIELDPRPVPQYMPDGSEVKTAEQVAGLLGIPLTEAALRLELLKDVYSGLATHALGVGVGTRIHRPPVVDRAKRPGLRKRKKRSKEESA